jgi:hypothetical protein
MATLDVIERIMFYVDLTNLAINSTTNPATNLATNFTSDKTVSTIQKCVFL